jgi:hypothetical protein
MDVANLSFSIDSSQAQGARRDLQELRQASSDASAQAKDLRANYASASNGLKEMAAANAELMRSMRENTSVLDQAIERIDRLQKSSRAFSDTARDMREVVQQMDGIARVFGSSAAGVENFSRAARQVGLDANDTVSALRRIQAAIEGVTAEGRASRSVLESYGVSVAGMGRDDAGQVLRAFAGRARATQDDPLTRFDMATLGISGPDAMARLDNDRFKSTAQRERERLVADQAAQAAPRRNAAISAMDDLDKRRQQLTDLDTEWGAGFSRPFGQSDADRLAALQGRQTEGLARGEVPFSQTFGGRLANAAERSAGQVTPFWRNPLTWAVQRTTAPLGQMVEDYQGSALYQANAATIDAQYQEDRFREGGMMPLRSMLGWATRRARLAFGDSSVDSEVTGDRPIEMGFGGAAVPMLRPDRRPVNPRTAGYSRETEELAMLGQLTPAQEMLRRVYGQAGQEFGLNTAGWDGMTPDQIWARDPGSRAGQGGFLPEQRDAITRRIQVSDAARNETFGIRLADYRDQRDAWRSGAQEGGYAGGERAAYQAEAEARAKGELMTTEQRLLRVRMEMAEFDDRRALRGEQATQQLRDQTKATTEYAEVLSQMVRSGADPITAAAAAQRAQATAAAAAQPGSPDADTRLQTSFEQSYAQASQQAAELARQVTAAEDAAYTAATGRLRVRSEETAVIERHRELHDALARAEALSGQARETALTRLREISAELERQRERMVEMRDIELTYRGANTAFRDANQAALIARGSPGGPPALPGQVGGLAAIGQEGAVTRDALRLYGDRPEIAAIQDPQLRAEAATGLMTPAQRQASESAWSQGGVTPQGAMAAALRVQIARLRADPNPANRAGNARRIADLEGQIAQLPPGQRELMSNAAGLEAGAAAAGASEGTLLQSRNALTIARGMRDWAQGDGRGMPESAVGDSMDARRSRLYGRDLLEASADAAGRMRAGTLSEGDSSDFVLQEMARRAANALEQFSRAADSAAISLEESGERVRAGSSYERDVLRAEQATRPEQARLRALAEQAQTPAERQELIAAANALPTRARQMTASQARERFADENRQAGWQQDDAEFEAANWWRSSWSLRREVAVRQTRRRVQDTYGDSISEDEREGLVQRSGQVAQYSEINRITQATREAFLGMNQAASAALEQIILRGGTARQVMSSLLASMASMGLRSAVGTGMNMAFDWLGSYVFGGGGGGIKGLGSVGGAGAIGTAAAAAVGLVTEAGAVARHYAVGGEAEGLREGIVDRATTFRMRDGGMGLAGEAGTEAVFDLVPRGDGSRGVRLIGADGRSISGQAAGITRDGGRLAVVPGRGFAVGGDDDGAQGIFPLVQGEGGRYGVAIAGRSGTATITRDRDGRMGILAEGPMRHFAAGGSTDAAASPMMAAAAAVLAIDPAKGGVAPSRQAAPASGGGMAINQNLTLNLQAPSGGGGQQGSPSPEVMRMIGDQMRRMAREGAEEAIANQTRLGNMLNPVF